MRLLLLLLFSLFWATAVYSLLEEDAGQLDFVVATAGHGPDYQQLEIVDDVWLLSSGNGYLASRHLINGTVHWRRHVESHDFVISKNNNKMVYTIDSSSSSIRAWHVETGAFVWEQPSVDKSLNRIWTFEHESREYVATDAGVVLDAVTGEVVDTPKASGKPSSDNKKHEQVQVICSDMETAVALEGSSFTTWRVDANGKEKDGMNLTSDFHLSPKDHATSLVLLSCSSDAMALLVTTERGTTCRVSISAIESSKDTLQAKTIWRQEEGLAQVTSAFMLDSSHYVGDVGEDVADTLLQLPNRLKSQWKSITEMLSPSSSVSDSREHFFGFVKVALLLSSSSHRLYAMDTSGPNRSKIRYQIDLPEAEYHRLVHGTANAHKAMHGINGGTHTREVLVLSKSSTNNEMHWICLEGTDGNVHSQGHVSLSANVVQTIPLLASGGPCRQSALLVLEDGSLVMVPDDDDTKASALQQVSVSENGFYTHVLERESAKLDSLAISATNGELETQLVGSTAFPGESIVAVAYPSRDEVIQSPCNVLGDDSLLLKYINPHMAAVVTMSNVVEMEQDKYASAMKASKTNNKQKRKPVGAGASSSTDPTPVVEDDEPNLFVNIVDLVSGRVIYRASHANAESSPAPTVLVSENWVFYTFVNAKTRRAEVGVLSLYDGMIDSKGLTAFTTPEQTNVFTSLDARDSKPAVLAKTFSLTKPATALGVTTTRGGISGRKLILASLDGQILAVERRMLEPRRPVGQVKDHEKKEGLQQYTELIPVISYMSLSYYQVIESVKHIVTAPTDLESQSLVLAFGGPDIFFARTSPSKGFDLLPDSFNRAMLSIVVFGLLVVLLMVKQMSSKKLRKQGWV